MKAMSDEGFLIICDIAAFARNGDSTSRLQEYVFRGSAFKLGINWVSLTCAYFYICWTGFFLQFGRWFNAVGTKHFEIGRSLTFIVTES